MRQWRLANGTIDGALIGEPDVTRAELAGSIVRLTEDFIDDIQVTAVYFKTSSWKPTGRDVEKFVAAYLRGARDLEGAGYRDPVNIAILEKPQRSRRAPLPWRGCRSTTQMAVSTLKTSRRCRTSSWSRVSCGPRSTSRASSI